MTNDPDSAYSEWIESKSVTRVNKPDFKKPVDVLAFFYSELGACGCYDIHVMMNVVANTLAWAGDKNAAGYDSLFAGDEGVYYLIMGLLESALLIGHGTSIRYPWLTDLGKELLNALNTIDRELIENAAGKAYDGCEYGFDQ